MTNLEIDLHNCLCESRGFKIARSSHLRCVNKKCVFKNFAKLTGNHLLRSLFFNNAFKIFFSNVFFKISYTGFFLSVLRNFWEHLFYRILPGDCFWIALMVKKFNYVLLIFLNLQLYHAPPEWSLLFWCNEEHLLMKKMSSVDSGPAIICEWNQREHVLTFFRT